MSQRNNLTNEEKLEILEECLEEISSYDPAKSAKMAEEARKKEQAKAIKDMQQQTMHANALVKNQSTLKYFTVPQIAVRNKPVQGPVMETEPKLEARHKEEDAKLIAKQLEEIAALKEKQMKEKAEQRDRHKNERIRLGLSPQKQNLRIFLYQESGGPIRRASRPQNQTERTPYSRSAPL